MIRSIAMIFAAVLVASPSLAQQSTAIDRVSVSLGQCVGSVEQRIDEIAALRQQLAAAQARVKALEEGDQNKPDQAGPSKP